MTKYGVSTEPNAMSVHRVTYGELGYPRYFYGPGDHFGWHVGSLLQHDSESGEIPVVSFKTYDQGDFELFAEAAAGIANEGCYVIYNHEPEKALKAGTLTVEELTAVYTAMRDVTAAYPTVKIASAFNRYQLTHGFDWRELQPVMALCDVVGVDCYSGDEYAVKNTYASAGELLDLALDMAAWAGKRLAVPEIGVRLAADKNDARRADQVRAYLDYMSTEGVMWASYFCNKNDNYHLTEPQTLRVWQTAMAATR